MCKYIELLDCTLRDGGYVNDWNFGNGNITYIFDRLNKARIDIIEIGFLDDRRLSDLNHSIQPNTESLQNVYAKVSTKIAKIFAMIDYGTCSIDNIQCADKTFIDGIRVIFKKEKMYEATEFGRLLIKKGYLVTYQMVSVTDYNDADVINFSNIVNEIKPYAVGIVDTYGLMHKEQMMHYFDLLNNKLDKSIGIGYHSHNNFQLAYSNTIEMIALHSNRKIIVDGSLYGMGKSAGNAPIELLAMHLNNCYNKQYDINQLLDAIDVSIMPIYQRHYWGYSLQFYIAAENDCHPNYVKYLLDKKTLAVKDINIILDLIENDKKLRYNEHYIESLYHEYITNNVNDFYFVDALANKFKNNNIVLIGPGKTIVSHTNEIHEYIQNNKPVVIAINYIPEGFDIDYIFISNSKRYSRMSSSIKEIKTKTIATSNIIPLDSHFDYVIRYDNLVTENDEIWDNALVIFINMVKKMSVKSIALAGFDGFSDNNEDNYIDESFNMYKDHSYLSAVNQRLTEKIKEFSKTMDIIFITPSKYELCDDNNECTDF